MQRQLSYLSLICCLSFLSQQSVVIAESAVSVPPDARAIAIAASADAQGVIDKEQEALDRTEAEFAVQRAVSEASDTAFQVAEAEKKLAEASIEADKAAEEEQGAIKQAKEFANHAASLRKAANQAEAAAEEATAAANQVYAALQAEESALERALVQRAKVESATATVRTESVKPEFWAKNNWPDSEELRSMPDDTDELLAKEKEIRELEDLQKYGHLAKPNRMAILGISESAMVEGNTSGANVDDSNTIEESAVDWSRADAAYSYAGELGRIAAAAEQQADQAEAVANEKNETAETLAEKSTEAKQAVLDNQLALEDAKKYALQAKDYVTEVQKALKQLIYSQEHPKPLHDFSAGINVYQWHDNLGNRGYQLTQPVEFNYWQKDFSYDLSTNYIISKNETAGDSGRVSTLTDTTLSMTKKNEKAKFIVDYNLNINIPTGKSALSWSERYAMMNEDLVEKSQFGQGWKFTPGLDVSWRIGKEDTWTLGTSYSFNRSYDPTSDIANDTIYPGNEWRRFLRWEHAGRNWQFVGEFLNTSTGMTKVEDGSQYSIGDQWEYRLTYNRHLSPVREIMYYFWRENRNVDMVVPTDANQALVHYFGAMLSQKLDDKHVFRASLDVMKSNGNCYAGIYNSYDDNGTPQYTAMDVAGRTKYTIGLGYDININKKDKVSVDVQAFTMKDGATTLGQVPTTYKGMNFLIKYNKNI